MRSDRCKRSLRLLKKKSPPSAHALPPAPGSIFSWQPLHLSPRSLEAWPCLNIYFVSASVAGGCRRACTSVGLLRLLTCVSFVPPSGRFPSGSFGFSCQFHSSRSNGGLNQRVCFAHAGFLQATTIETLHRTSFKPEFR
jgi:hypothetical protein